MQSGIYCIECNGVKYVGQAKDIVERFKQHLGGLKNNKHFNPYMQRLWNKYSDRFSFSVVEHCSPEELNDKEVYWIDKLNTLSPNGMNLVQGGNVKTPTDEIRKKISNANKGNKYCLGRKQTEESKKKQSLSKHGIPTGKKNKKATSKYHGVHLYKGGGYIYWQARITVNGKLISLGYHKSEQVAAQAYNKYVIENGLPNPLNQGV